MSKTPRFSLSTLPIWIIPDISETLFNESGVGISITPFLIPVQWTAFTEHSCQHTIMELQRVYAATALSPTEGQIRLLTISPSKPGESTSLDVSIRVASLNEEYTALSYCWGDPKVLEPCTVNGVETTITVNLAAALNQFKAEGKGNENCNFWIDAVCINQKDSLEKKSQVSMMSEIYARAHKTILWLGKSGDNSDTVMDFLADVEVRGQGYFDSYDSTDESPLWQDLRNFLSRPWWSRLWVIQEAMISQRPIMKCGTKEVPFNQLVQLKSLHETNIYQDDSKFVMIRNLWHGCPFAALLWDNWQAWKGRELAHWIPDVGQFQCEKLRDKLYGLLGLVSARAKKMIEEDVTINYDEDQKKDRDIVIEAALICFHEDGLLLLQFRQTDKNPTLQLPSWTPDWTTTALDMPLLGFGFDAFPSDCLLQLPGKEEWLHPDFYQKRFAYRPDLKALLLHGFLVDRVDFVSIMPEEPIPTVNDANELAESKKRRAEKTRKTCELWESEVLLNKQDAYNGPGETGCAEAFYRTIIANRNLAKKSIESPLKPIFDTWQGRDLPAVMLSASESEKNAFTQDFRFCAITRCAKRAFVTTEKGYFGLVPKDTKVGDYVCLLYSGKVAYILRPSHDEAHVPGTFVGEAYVHGIMNGEYLKESNLSTWTGFWVN